MKVAKPEWQDVFHIMANLREWDRKEIFALQWTDDPRSLSELVTKAPAFAVVAGLERPIAYLGAMPMWPGVWSMSLFATDEWRRISTSMTKHIAGDMLPTLWSQGAHRLECRCMDGHPSEKWLRRFGAEREGTLRAYGKNKETFHVYSIVGPPDVSKESVWRRGR